MINVDDDEENLNKEIISQDDEHYDNIELDEVFFFFFFLIGWIRWSWLNKMMNMMKNNYYFGSLTCLSLLSLINLNVYVINTC